MNMWQMLQDLKSSLLHTLQTVQSRSRRVPEQPFALQCLEGDEGHCTLWCSHVQMQLLRGSFSPEELESSVYSTEN